MKIAQIVIFSFVILDFSGLFHNSGGRNFLDNNAMTIARDANPNISEGKNSKIVVPVHFSCLTLFDTAYIYSFNNVVCS